LKYEAANRLLYFKYNICADIAGYSFSTFAVDLLAALDSNPVDTWCCRTRWFARRQQGEMLAPTAAGASCVD
jgi:hypothetical protein